uniref:Uncharacterized protein n=1 Tax=Romanomermis culicivorax TaxID=13658 RepID=A0A915JP22_ROMCU
MPKKKKKSQHDQWNTSPAISDDGDPTLLPKKLWDDPKQLQAAITTAMQTDPETTSDLMASAMTTLALTMGDIEHIAPVMPIVTTEDDENLQQNTDRHPQRDDD